MILHFAFCFIDIYQSFQRVVERKALCYRAKMTDLTSDAKSRHYKTLEIGDLEQMQDETQGQGNDSNDDNGGQERNHFMNGLRRFVLSERTDIFLKVIFYLVCIDLISLGNTSKTIII